MKKLVLVLSALSACFVPAHATLVFDLCDTNAQPDPQIETSSTYSFVDGVSIKTGWGDIQKNGPTAYNWNFLDTAVNNATKYNKQIEIRVLIEGNFAPSWVMSDPNVQTFKPTGAAAIWLPWDTTALGYLNTFFSALGARYGSNPAVTIVVACIMSDYTGDWDEQVATQLTALPGYSDTLAASGSERVIGMIATNFPYAHVYASLGRLGTPPSSTLGETIGTWGYDNYPNQFEAGKNTWDNCIPNPPGTAPGTYWEPMWYFWMQGKRLACQEAFVDDGDPQYQDNCGNQQTYASIMRQMLALLQPTDWNVASEEIYQTDIEAFPNVIANYK